MFLQTAHDSHCAPHIDPTNPIKLAVEVKIRS